MEFCNFSEDEIRRINRALTFIGNKEVDLDRVSGRTTVIKTDDFENECRRLASYYPHLGLESAGARLVFDTDKDGGHKILLNRHGSDGLAGIHALATELVHLGNLSRYNADHGNVYRLNPEQAIADHYYEFLLWSHFLAMKIATRVHALAAWHEVNGAAPPVDGCYRFSQIAFPDQGLRAALIAAQQAEALSAWREGYWDLLEELARYFGRLAFYQQEPLPAELDERFPSELIREVVGLDNCLAFYGTLLRARDYPAWQAEKHTLRRFVLAMQEHGKDTFPTEN
ncbi:hypothetical protein [Desulfobulbus sp.]|uniref:hypothetical protein n=1 Tax=Desulfobulbus sp. TaxID=895 RepID=UPI00286F5A12|nr:hypothetical protein [Desulfobulbus sp.]